MPVPGIFETIGDLAKAPAQAVGDPEFWRAYRDRLMRSTIISSMVDAVKAPYAAYKGELDPYNAYEAMNVGLNALGGGTAISAMGKPIGAGVVGAQVYHGSPYKFSAFDASKIGTGEGAQAYGHGLYFAENPSVAGSYIGGQQAFIAEPLIGGKKVSELPKDLLRKWEMESGGTSYGMLDEFRKVADPKATLDFYKRGGGPLAAIASEIERLGIQNRKAGNLYKVDLPDEHIGRMLDWDKPLSEQPANVQAAFKTLPKMTITDGMDLAGGGKLRIQQDADFGTKYFLSFPDGKNFKLSPADVERLVGTGQEGKSLYQALTTQFGGGKQGEVKASEYLKSLGIPGIRFLDQGSRSAGKGTHNYVVFDDKLPKIIEQK